MHVGVNIVQKSCKAVVAEYLTTKGFDTKDPADVPVETVWQTLKRPVPGMRVSELPENLRDEFLKKPITCDLLCTAVGHHKALPTHYMPRPAGFRDFIFIYCADGRGWLEMDGHSWTVDKHCGFLIPRHVPHIYGADPENPWTAYWVHFQGTQAEEFADTLCYSQKPPIRCFTQFQEIVACMEQLCHYMNELHTYTSMLAGGGVLSHLLAVVNMQSSAQQHHLPTQEESLHKTVEFMHLNIDQHLTIKELAAIAGMSIGYYGTLFRERYGSTPIDYFNQLKIQSACELLTSNKMTVNEVSEQLGFSRPTYFSRLFKKTEGVSPRDYLKEQTG